MKKGKKIVLTLWCCLLMVFVSNAQNDDDFKWFEELNNPNANIELIKEKAEKYFDKYGRGKGSGWKVYKRWEYFISQYDFNNNVKALNRDQGKFRVLNQKKLRNKSQQQTSQGNWSILGPYEMPSNHTSQPNGLGRLSAIAFHPEDEQTIYVGTPASGIWKTTDFGNTWEDIGHQIQGTGVNVIQINPNNPNIMYIGTGDRDGGVSAGIGVWKTIDGGNNWFPINTIMGNTTINDLIIDPNNSNKIIAASSDNSIYISTNAGSSWTKVFVGHRIMDLDMHPANSNIIYASGSKFYRSTNGGFSFQNKDIGISNAHRIAISTTPIAPNKVYAIAGNTSTGFLGLMVSSNSGASFIKKSDSPNILGYSTNGGSGSQAHYDLCILAHPTKANEIYIGGINMWKSTNDGVNWQIISYWAGETSTIDDVHADQHVLAYHHQKKFIFSGNDGGIHYSTDEGRFWNEISSGLAIAQVYKIGQSMTEKDLLLNGYQDNGTSMMSSSNFYTTIGGDGMECAIDPENSNNMYGSIYYGNIRRSTSKGTGFITIASNGFNGITERGGWVTPYKLDINEPKRMFIGYQNLWKSENVVNPEFNSVQWNKISNFDNSASVIDFDISNSNTIYLSKSGNRFYRTFNALSSSPTWVTLSNKLPQNYTPKDIVIDPEDRDHLWIVMFKKVYESFNGGNSWTDISSGLPNVVMNTLVMDQSNRHLYLGTDIGVYFKSISEDTWRDFSEGLPIIKVTELEIYKDAEFSGNHRLRAATYGRGLWESPLFRDENAKPEVHFTLDQTNLCMSQTVQFHNLTINTVDQYQWEITGGDYEFVKGSRSTDKEPFLKFKSLGNYSIKLIAQNQFGSNYKEKINYITINESSFELPIEDHFDDEVICSNVSNCESQICTLTSSYWKNDDTNDQIDWRVSTLTTPTSNTGPSTDFNSIDGNGNYLYLEASNSCYGRTANLISPCLDLSIYKDPVLVFNYHLFGQHSGEIHIDVQMNGNWINDYIPVIKGDHGDQWKEYRVDLSNERDDITKIRIRGIIGDGYLSDISIDQIKIDFTEKLTASLNQISNSEIKLYPNPFENVIHIENINLEQEQIYIYDVLGKSLNFKLNKLNTQHFTINSDSFLPGIYIIKIKNKTYKLIKE